MDSKLGERIRRRRKQLGMTLRDLAGDRVTPAQISAVEKGKCKPSSSLLYYISQRLECEVEDLVLTNIEKSQRDFEGAKLKSQKLLDEGRLDEAITVIIKFFDLIDSLTDEQKGFCYHLKGDFMYRSEDYNNAFDFYIKSLTNYLRTREINIICSLNRKIGNCLYSTRKYDLALGYYITASSYFNLLTDDPEIRIITIYDLSLCYLSLKMYDLAEEYINVCIDIIGRDNMDKNKMFPDICIIKGLITRGFNKLQDSFDYFNRAFTNYSNSGNKFGMGRAKNNLAQCLLDLGEFKDAEAYFFEAIEYKQQAEDRTLSDSYISLAELYKQMGNMDKALDSISKAEEEVLNQQSISKIIDVYIKKFDFLIEIMDYDKAEIAALYALDFIQKSQDSHNETRLYLRMADMYRRQGDNRNAMDYLLKVNNYSLQ
jgi:tetratricopeptide (TPR) repeat protein